MNFFRKISPIFYFDSKVPFFVKKVTGIDAIACSLGPFVFFKSKKTEVPAETVRHETIHFFQQLELLFVFQWILYGFFHLIGLIKTHDRRWAYLTNPFELEAYDNEGNVNYLRERSFFAWVKYVKSDINGSKNENC